MKQFTIEVSGASTPQLLTIAAELKIMSNGWARMVPGSRSTARSFKPQASGFPDQGASMDPETASHKLQAII